MLKLIKLKTKYYQITGTYYIKGKPYYIRNKTTKCVKKNEAEIFLSNFLDNIKINNSQRMTVKRAIDIFIEKKKPTKNYLRYYRHLQNLSEQINLIYLDDLTGDSVDKMILKRYPKDTEIGDRIRKYKQNFNEIEIEERKKLSSHHNTINTTLIGIVQSLIRFANSENRNWCSNFNLSKLPLISDDLRDRFFWNINEVRDCMGHNDYEIKFLLIFLFRTGCRIQEGLSLHWNDRDHYGNPVIDMENKVLRIFQNKSKGYKVIPIHENHDEPGLSLWHWLNKINNRDGSLFFWKNLQDKKNDKNLGLGKRWNSMLEFANIDPRKKRHAVRHGFASMIGNNGGSDNDIKALGGWKTTPMVGNYNHKQMNSKREVLNKL